MATKPKKPDRGDLIEIFRGVYQHWAVYVGDGDVIHLVRETWFGAGSISERIVHICEKIVGQDKATVRRERLQDVVGRDEYRVNNLLDNQHEAHHIEDILQEAQRLVGERLPYNLLTHNCEHFAKMLRYGEPYSRQVVKTAVDNMYFATRFWPNQ